MQANIVVLPGDGIGPEITAVAVEVPKPVATRFGPDFSISEHDIPALAFPNHRRHLPAPTP
ncbi:hypothetical protein ABB34_11595, partial [Stenotrophomonas daejeonensis]